MPERMIEVRLKDRIGRVVAFVSVPENVAHKVTILVHDGKQYCFSGMNWSGIPVYRRAEIFEVKR